MEVDKINLSDGELIKKMRTDNYERFVALVRMHLSFELDMNTDEFDMPCHEIMYYDKGKMKKLNRLTKKIKSCTSGKILSPATEDNSVQLSKDLIKQLRILKEFLMDEGNIKQEGIFRLTGAISRQNELRKLVNSLNPFDVRSAYTVHDCATVFKSILSNLPEPLLTDAHYLAYCQIAELCNNLNASSSHIKEIHVLNSIQLLLFLLPEENRTLLIDIIEMLNKTIAFSESNKMTADSLATLFSPHLICPRNLPAEALYDISQNMSKIVSYMITKGLQIFEAPAKLITDIRAYYIEQNRKLDESISDLSTVNTVYTFVDREKTAAANDSDPTDTALAQLYAHIQSLPESSKKRKLIRQFNKENGQGTPLQLLIMNRIRNEGSSTRKSISDSIKKHIFHKNLISRTPKRSNNSLLNLGTPNAATKPTKTRLLFQSPVCNSNLNINASSSSIKKHNLHKSISSSSLLTTPKILNMNQSPKVELLKKSPISRQQQPTSTIVSNNETFNQSTSSLSSPLPSSAINHTNSEKEKAEEESEQKNMVEDELMTQGLNNLDSIANIQKKFSNSKHKSEPNLSRIPYENSTLLGDSSSSSSFSSPAAVTRTTASSISSNHTNNIQNLTRRNNSMINIKIDCELQNLHDDADFSSLSESINNVIDSPIFKIGTSSSSSSTSHVVCCNKNLITSTPSVFLDRRSMSPITKSTQRMPKSMQESIMTPRSRKPVMLTTTLGSSEQNHTASSLREEDEDSFLNAKNQNEFIEYQSSITIKDNMTSIPDKNMLISSTDSLSNTFREYLLSRKVVTTSPEDSSFSSHSDDFGSTPDIYNLTEGNLSESLLYCLNGNNPIQDNSHCSSSTPSTSSSSLSASDINNKGLCDNFDAKKVLNVISRKRSFTQSIPDEDNDDNDKENCDGNNLSGKKLLIVQETSTL